jgi:hypothetical protein
VLACVVADRDVLGRVLAAIPAVHPLTGLAREALLRAVAHKQTAQTNAG